MIGVTANFAREYPVLLDADGVSLSNVHVFQLFDKIWD